MRKVFLALSLFIIIPCLTHAFSSPEKANEKGGADNLMQREVLTAHNKYRAQLEMPPLVWSETLAAHAMQWADHLAKSGGQLCHSGVSGQGENLWKGTANCYSDAQKVEHWASKRKYFKNGIFPYVSTTGNWADVGHYSQMIWRQTAEVGCAKAGAGKHEIFVCRYAPAGNIMTRKYND